MNRVKQNRGFVLILVLAVLAMLSLLGLTFITINNVERDISRSYLDLQRAKFLAESGVHYATVRLKDHLKNPNWFFTTTPESGAWIYWGDVTDEAAVGASPNSLIPLEMAKNPSFAYEDEPAQDPTNSTTSPKLIKVNGNDVGFSGFMDASTYGRESDVYTLKVTDLTGRIYINDGLGHALNTANLKRLLDNLGTAVGVSGLGNSILDNRPASGYHSVSDLLRFCSTADYDKFKDFVTVYAWVDDKVVNPVPLSPLGTVTSFYLPELINARPIADPGSRTNPTATDTDGHIFRYGRGKNAYNQWVGGGAAPTSLQFGSSIFGWDELNPCYIEKTSRAPVNINTASYEVLVALLDGLQGFFVMETPGPQGGGNAYSNLYWRWYDYQGTSGHIGIVYRTAIITGPAGPVSGTSPASMAEKIADAIIKNRNKKTVDITKEYEGPFTSWAQFNRFIDSLVKTPTNPTGIIEESGTRFDSIQASYPNSPVKVMANQAMADAIKANFNPNLHLNEINPNAALNMLVDKTDLIRWSSEFCFTPMGFVEVESLGRVLKPISTGSVVVPEFQEVAQKKIRVIMKLFDTYRDDLQKNFYDGKITADGVTEDTDTNCGLPDIAAVTGYRTSNNLPLETGPEPDNGSAPMENEYEGYVALSTIGGDLPLDATFATSKGLTNNSKHKPKGDVWETPRGTQICTTSGANAHSHYNFDFDLHYGKASDDVANDDKRRALTRLWNKGLGSLQDNIIPIYNYADWSETGTPRDGSAANTISVATYDINSIADPNLVLTGTWVTATAWTTGSYTGVGLFGGSAIYTLTAGSQAEFTFTGNGVALYSVMSIGNPRASSVYIDDILDTNLNHYNQRGSYNSNGVLSYIRSGLPSGIHRFRIVHTGGSGTWIDKLEVFSLTPSSAQTSPRIGPYSYVDSPSVTPFATGSQTSRYRICRSYTVPVSSGGPEIVPTYPIFAPSDLRTDGGYNERHAASLYWPGRANSLTPGTDDGTGMNFWMRQGGVSYWIKPGYYPEIADKLRAYFSTNRIHRRNLYNPSPFGHWYMPGQQMTDTGSAFYTDGVGYWVPTTRTFGWGYSHVGWEYSANSANAYFYYPGAFAMGGLMSGPVNHIGHSEAGATARNKNKFKGHGWIHVTLLWDMAMGSPLPGVGSTSVDMLINGQPPATKQVFFRPATGNGIYTDMNKQIWNISDGGYLGNGQFYINPLRLGDPSNSAVYMNFCADSTIDEFYVWPRRGNISTMTTGHYEGRSQFQIGRYYRNNNGIFTSRDINLNLAGGLRQLPIPASIPLPGEELPPIPGSSTTLSATPQLLGVAWTLLSEDYRFSGNQGAPMEYLLYDYKPQTSSNSADPTLMTQKLEVQVSGDGGSTWGVDVSGNPVFTNPGWNSVRNPAGVNTPLPISDPTKIKYKVKFVTTGLVSDSVLLETPVLDDVVLYYTRDTGIEIVEYVVL